MTEPDRSGDVPSPSDPDLPQKVESLKILLEDVIIEGVLQNVTAMKLAADGLLYRLDRGHTISTDRLYTNLELMSTACQHAATRIEEARQQLSLL